MTTIHWLNDGKNEGGVAERQFVIKGGKGPVPGIIWAPDPVESPVPLVLFGHGGSGHKRNDRSLMLGRRLAGVSRYAVVAIDGPTHGDRAHPQSVSEGVDPMEVLADIGVDTALDGMVEDWCATLDHVTECDFINPDQVAYVGFSMGTRFGLPFVAAAGGRLRCAVLGKNALEPSDKSRMANSPGHRFKMDAPKITIPVLFHMQWDDELFSRESQCGLFDLIGSEDKRLIAYPGPHGRSTPEAVDSWCRFLEGHLIA
ncbi:MAG: alpha/beta fold hydrolase [Dehalococcoidia bacterium]|jgi:pimeloyl-ACP methyl ester carboxylesterase|nr:alpha/beta fold hydrolase [Dehalococcoidia bacterium]MEE2927965.1 alpha/beta fold hydrolase [Chloroflexota bacterium]|tara:strand:+ start:595 stop:1365 length:771 start_codon:yes stop_codon:yes gene_type:complete